MHVYQEAEFGAYCFFEFINHLQSRQGSFVVSKVYLS